MIIIIMRLLSHPLIAGEVWFLCARICDIVTVFLTLFVPCNISRNGFSRHLETSRMNGQWLRIMPLSFTWARLVKSTLGSILIFGNDP